MVGAIEDVEEAQLDEAQSRLVPARIEPHEPRIAVELQRARVAGGRKKLQGREHPQSQPRESRVNRKRRAIRDDLVLEEHVEQLLVPVQVHVVGQARPGDMGERRLE